MARHTVFVVLAVAFLAGETASAEGKLIAALYLCAMEPTSCALDFPGGPVLPELVGKRHCLVFLQAATAVS